MKYFYKNTDRLRRECKRAVNHCEEQSLQIMRSVSYWEKVGKDSDDFLMMEASEIEKYMSAKNLMCRILDKCVLKVDEIELTLEQHSTLQKFFKVPYADIITREEV